MSSLRLKKKRDVEDEEEDLPKRKKKGKAREQEVDEDELDEDDESEEALDEDDSEDDDDEEEEPVRKKKSKKSSGKKSSKKSGDKKKRSFLKTGKARAAAFKAEETRDKAREEAFGKTRRFFIHQDRIDDDFEITFVDGDLGDDGLLDTPTFREHSMKINGRWTQFVSCEDEEPDPLQQDGKEPYFAQIFTIIDHTGYQDRDGKWHKNIKRPFVAKKKTIKQLQKLAGKKKCKGGLSGCTFTVCRTSDKDPNVGNQFDFENKHSLKDIAKQLMAGWDEDSDKMKKEDALAAIEPFDYEEVLTYYTADELEDMGLCDRAETISTKRANKDEDLDEDLDEDDLDDELDEDDDE